MTYTEFKKYSSITLWPSQQQQLNIDLGENFRPVLYFFYIFNTSDKASELLSTIDQLVSDEDEEIRIPGSTFKSYLKEEEGQDKMKQIYEMLSKDDQGNVTFNKGDFIYELAHNFGVIGLIKLLGQPEWEHGNLFSYRFNDYCIELDTEMNQTLNIRKNKTAIIGWEIFPKIVFFETSQIYEIIDHWRHFLWEYENGKIPNIIPENKQGEWVIVPKEFVKEEYWENSR